jgi:hypothetical protein
VPDPSDEAQTYFILAESKLSQDGSTPVVGANVGARIGADVTAGIGADVTADVGAPSSPPPQLQHIWFE